MIYSSRIIPSIALTALFHVAACIGHVESAREAEPQAPLASNEWAESLDEEARDATTDAGAGVRNGRIYLPRSMIGLRLLESTEVALTGASPDITYTKPRIVYFALYTDRLALFETNAVAPHRDLRADHLIDTFPILESSPTTVAFAAPHHLRGISTALPYDVADGALTGPMQYPEGTVFDVDHAVLEGVTLEGQTLRMRHALTVRTNTRTGLSMFGNPEHTVLSTRYVRTTLTPYAPSPTFTPLQVRGSEGRYFQVATVAPNTGALTYHAMHWDTSPAQPPIAFGLAQQMPAGVAQAVSEGLTYWNRVAGREILRVTHNVDVASWNGPRQVPVHWIGWDTAPDAHAAVQADPLTGEVIAARMFLTSGFSASAARQFDREALLAAREDPHRAAGGSREQGLSGDLRRRAERDTMRLLAAHECGHILGLRHNFAGMLDSELTEAGQVQQAASAYVRGHKPQNRVSSTVMTYTGARSFLLLGASIESRVLPYDEAAIALLYAHPKDDAHAPPMAFCGDMEVDSVYGCSHQLDGIDVLRDSADKARSARFDIALALLDGIYKGVERNGGRCDARVYEHVSLDALAVPVGSHAGTVFTAFQATDAVAVRQQFGLLRHLDPAMYRMFVEDHIVARSAAVGGLAGWIGYVLDAPEGAVPAPGWLRRDVAFHMANASLPDLARAPEAKRLWVEQIAIAWSERVEELVLKKIFEALTAHQDMPQTLTQMLFAGSNPQHYPHALVDPSWEKPLANLVTAVVLDLRGDGQPRYGEDVRISALPLLSERLFNTPSFGAAAREDLKERLLARAAAAADSDDRRLQQRSASDMKVRLELLLTEL